MTTRVATSVAQGTALDAAGQLAADVLSQLGGARPAFAIVFASVEQPLAALMPALQARLKPELLLGASSAGEFTEARHANGAAVVFAVAGDLVATAGIGTGLKANAEAAVAAAVSKLPLAMEGHPHRTGILLLDPLSGAGEEATLHASLALGHDVRLAGGAAGDNLAMAATYVGVGDRVESDAVVVATLFSKRPFGVGVCHGHRALSKSLKVTKAHDNVVEEIDGRPAWLVWKEQTSAAARAVGLDPEKLPPEAIGAYLLRYEAGLSAGDELKIRAPLSKQDDGSLSFACGIPQGSVIRITESEPERQIDSAREAARRARTQTDGGPIAGALVFDCVCRKLILGDRFGGAVKGIADELGGVKLAGFETYGEIALNSAELSGFHNTTTVVLAFPG